MKNVSIKIDADTLQEIVEQHLNEGLAPGTHARVSQITASVAPNYNPGSTLSGWELLVSFDAVAKVK